LQKNDTLSEKVGALYGHQSTSLHHTRSDGIPEKIDVSSSLGSDNLQGNQSNKDAEKSKVICNACPVLCQISLDRSGACDRYANLNGELIRLGSLVVLDFNEKLIDQRNSTQPSTVKVFEQRSSPEIMSEASANSLLPQNIIADQVPSDSALFVTGVGSSTTYPDYKPAPFIVSSTLDGVDMVTVVTEGIFSYCSFKVKIDTDRYLGPEQADITYKGEVIGHVSTAEYGSQMFSIGGVNHLTGGSKKEGRLTLEAMLGLGNAEPIEVVVKDGATVVLQAGAAPVVDGVVEKKMRVGCGSAAIGIFAEQWQGLVDEVVVVDDHITGVLTEHQAGKCLNMKPSGIKVRGRKSTPGRYFQVASPGLGWGGTDISDPLDILEEWDKNVAYPGLRLLMTSTTGEHAQWYQLDANLTPIPGKMPQAVQAVIDRLVQNCEPSKVSVLFLAGAGGSLRAGVTENPVLLTNAIKEALVKVTCGGAPAFVWPGGGITIMVDVLKMPAMSFGAVPTPAIVAPIEFSMRLDQYQRLGGHMKYVKSIEDTLLHGAWHNDGAPKSLQIRASLLDQKSPYSGLL
jgi:hypothetical protein